MSQIFGGRAKIFELLDGCGPAGRAYEEALSGRLPGPMPLLKEPVVDGQKDPYFTRAFSCNVPFIIRPGMEGTEGGPPQLP